MAVTMSNAELQKALLELRAELRELKLRYEKFAVMFAWYYLDEERREFAIILRFNDKTKAADLVCLSEHVNGRTHIVTNRKMKDSRPGWPKAKCWEPIDPPERAPKSRIFEKLTTKVALAESMVQDEATEDAAAPKSALTARS